MFAMGLLSALVLLVVGMALESQAQTPSGVPSCSYTCPDYILNARRAAGLAVPALLDKRQLPPNIGCQYEVGGPGTGITHHTFECFYSVEDGHYLTGDDEYCAPEATYSCTSKRVMSRHTGRWVAREERVGMLRM